ncbi:reverse transcriptase domain-containing protein, partial [Tanacetum coccineum]
MYEHVSPKVTSSQEGKDYKMAKEIMLGTRLPSELEHDILPMTPRDLQIVSSGVKLSSGKVTIMGIRYTKPNALRDVSNNGLLGNLSKSPREILATKKDAKAFEQPPRMAGNRKSRDMSKYYHFHEDHGHETNQCRDVRHQIKEVVKSGQLAHLVKGIKKGKAKASDTQLGEWKKGDKDIIPYEAPILMVNKEGHTSKRNSAEEAINITGEITFPTPVSALNSYKDKKTIQWTTDVEEAFRKMKEFIEIFLTLTSLIKVEVLVMYLTALAESISAVLLAEREKRQVPIYLVSSILQGSELNYPKLEKLILALVHAARRLRSSDGSGAGIMLVSLEGKEYTYVIYSMGIRCTKPNALRGVPFDETSIE